MLLKPHALNAAPSWGSEQHASLDHAASPIQPAHVCAGLSSSTVEDTQPFWGLQHPVTHLPCLQDDLVSVPGAALTGEALVLASPEAASVSRSSSRTPTTSSIAQELPGGIAIVSTSPEVDSTKQAFVSASLGSTFGLRSCLETPVIGSVAQEPSDGIAIVSNPGLHRSAASVSAAPPSTSGFSEYCQTHLGARTSTSSADMPAVQHSTTLGLTGCFAVQSVCRGASWQRPLVESPQSS
jgi:hypothetical protein